MTYDYGNLLAVLEALVQVVRQTLGRCTYGVDVHTVGTYTHNAAQTARTELQVFVEGLDQLVLVRIFQHSFHFCLCLGIVCRSQPLLGFGSHFLNQSFIFHSKYFN